MKHAQLSLFPKEEEPEGTGGKPAEESYDLTDLFERLAKSEFRMKFRLSGKDLDYISDKGLDTIRRHARDFIAKRLAPAVIPNDGRQTPMRGHPVFLAQHATGCCSADASPNGTIFLPEENSQKPNNAMPSRF